MSFYDLVKEGVLGPEDLFKYRSKRDSSIPSRGGQKEFEPDGSWIQTKQLEAFIEERTSILSEARVEKLKSVVEGVWDDRKKLVDLKKPGKFWMYMGFTDERRNWLYPEEALYLMETNTLELYHRDRPMSIQEAYVKLLGHGICLEEYQVFSHLRRLGFVVLRHEEEKIFTDYERRINLTEYIGKKKIRERMSKGKGKSNKKISQTNTCTNNETGHQSQDSLNNDIPNNSSKVNDNQLNGSPDDSTNGSSNLCSKRSPEEELTRSEESKRIKLANENGETNSEGISSIDPVAFETDSSFYTDSSWSSCFTNHSVENGKQETGKINLQSDRLTQTVLDSDSVSLFPDASINSTTSLKTPPSQLLPPDLEVTQLDIDVTLNHLKESSLNRLNETTFTKEDSRERIFSCLNGMGKQPRIKASSWSEYKRKKSEKLSGVSPSSLVDHLWKDSMTPLMHPSEITSYQDVMNRLQIIQTAGPEDLNPDVSGLVTLPKVCFDVHLPDHHFKKSLPGIPDHRVCVTRSDGVPPGLNAIQHLSTKCEDSVPLHWAVVDSGEIAFYVFDNTKQVEVLGI